MSLKSLVVCSDEKILRVLRRVLSDLEIGMEHSADADSAINKLTRQRFEAVIVDCADEHQASLVLRSARAAPCNKRAVAVAIIDGQKAVRSAFELGAHFVLYKPISAERAKSSFRAARALMKRERRRNTRVPVELPVTLVLDHGAGQQRTVTSDLGEGGMALQLKRRPKNAASMVLHFTLPGAERAIEARGEVAWENAGRQVGIRFVDLSPENHQELKAWLNHHSPEPEKDDPPARCKLTDLSPGGCYVEVSTPFPARTRIILSMRVGELQLQVEGVVRVMHPEAGMGVEFTQSTPQQKEQVEKFIRALVNSKGAVPDLVVEPEGLDTDEPLVPAPAAGEVEDPLIELFRRKGDVTTEAFLIELRKQRGSSPAPKEPAVSV